MFNNHKDEKIATIFKMNGQRCEKYAFLSLKIIDLYLLTFTSWSSSEFYCKVRMMDIFPLYKNLIVRELVISRYNKWRPQTHVSTYIKFLRVEKLVNDFVARNYAAMNLGSFWNVELLVSFFVKILSYHVNKWESKDTLFPRKFRRPSKRWEIFFIESTMDLKIEALQQPPRTTKIRRDFRISSIIVVQ